MGQEGVNMQAELSSEETGQLAHSLARTSCMVAAGPCENEQGREKRCSIWLARRSQIDKAVSTPSSTGCAHSNASTAENAMRCMDEATSHPSTGTC